MPGFADGRAASGTSKCQVDDARLTIEVVRAAHRLRRGAGRLMPGWRDCRRRPGDGRGRGGRDDRATVQGPARAVVDAAGVCAGDVRQLAGDGPGRVRLRAEQARRPGVRRSGPAKAALIAPSAGPDGRFIFIVRGRTGSTLDDRHPVLGRPGPPRGRGLRPGPSGGGGGELPVRDRSARWRLPRLPRPPLNSGRDPGDAGPATCRGPRGFEEPPRLFTITGGKRPRTGPWPRTW